MTFQHKLPLLPTPVSTGFPAHCMQNTPVSAFLFSGIPAVGALVECDLKAAAGEAACRLPALPGFQSSRCNVHVSTLAGLFGAGCVTDKGGSQAGTAGMDQSASCGRSQVATFGCAAWNWAYDMYKYCNGAFVLPVGCLRVKRLGLTVLTVSVRCSDTK